MFFIDAPADEEEGEMPEDDSLNADWAAGLLDDDEPAISVDAANNRAGGRKSAGKDSGKKDTGKKSAGKKASGRKFGAPAWMASVRASAARIPRALVLAVIVGGGMLGALLGRESVVRSVPATALLYDLAGMSVNLRGLDITNVTSTVTTEANGRYLTIEGEIANTTATERRVPQITISLWGEARQTLYSWSVEPPRANLAPGETTRFRARLVAPPDEARQVLVRFAPDADGTTIAEGGN
ncbi:MAG TPA: FxLYD domain-containing protein [Saliniramus sp.]|nr:FxLYD domain-containing protein [Saliniramus sp.]